MGRKDWFLWSRRKWFVNHLDVIINLLHQNGVEIDELEDPREKVDLKFPTVDKDYPADKVWPQRTRPEGQNIELRDYPSRSY